MFLSITSSTWLMSLIGVGIVFLILVLLVVILNLFNHLFPEGSSKNDDKVSGLKNNLQGDTNGSASELDKAAIATAVYLYYNELHDNESNVLTINQSPSHWHAVLNERL
jgi:Na+-transporting methylmalonyl-CoA/oxaloacetate decarboxylase gamma subunit